jgi:hypothetical protein
MTICIAAIAGNGMIFGASDRMITSGDIEYEPTITEETREKGAPLKVFHVTNSIAVMTAGDASTHSEILQNVLRVVGARISQDKSNWWNVADVAQLYVDSYDALKLRRSASAILAPMGLNPDTFFSRQTEMADAFIRRITDDLTTYSMPDIETIITGIDRTGAHIYVVHNRTNTGCCVASCEDTVGFSAIGIGAHHAQSQFMFAGHHKASPIPESIFLIYLAKKRAEVAPGVGEETDMIFAGPAMGTLQNVRPSIVLALEGIYQTHRTAERAALDTSWRQMNQYVSELTRASVQPQESPPGGATGATGPAVLSNLPFTQH